MTLPTAHHSITAEQETPVSGTLALVVEYEGTAYQGFQVQPGLPTVQGALEQALEKLYGAYVKTHSASRTDAGVHALEQVVTIDVPKAYRISAARNALNHYLPEDIKVHDVYAVDADFDPRRDAASRTYEYAIWNAVTLSPMLRRVTHHVPQTLDVALMNEAAQVLLGTHDFANFTTLEEARTKSTQRTVLAAGVERKGDLVTFTIEAHAYLIHQVRRIAGALVEVGLGRMEVSDFAAFVYRVRQGQAGPGLPANGLTLRKIAYQAFPPAPRAVASGGLVTHIAPAHRRVAR